MPFDFIKHLGLNPAALRKKYGQIEAFCGIFALDDTGQNVAVSEIEDRLPAALTFPDIRNLARPDCAADVALLGAGSERVSAVLCSLRAGMCNSLFVDQPLAEALYHEIAE
jgi:hypothetical protein